MSSGGAARGPDGPPRQPEAATPPGWAAPWRPWPGESSQPVARYRYDVLSRTWWWSRDMYLMHGFEPGEVVPTTELMVAHQDVGDRGDAPWSGPEAVLTGGEPFCWRHRIIDAGGRTRTVLSLGEGSVTPVATWWPSRASSST